MDTIELVFFPRADEEFIYLEFTSLELLVPCFVFFYFIRCYLLSVAIVSR